MPKLSKQEQADILLSDFARWSERQQAENAPTDTSRAALADWTCERPLLRGIGMVGTSGTNRRYPKPPKRERAHGAAAMPPDADSAERLASGDIEATVLVTHADGTSVVRTVASFRKTGKRTKVTQAAAATPDTARFTHGHDFNS